MDKVLVIGSLNMDMTIKVDKFPQVGETILGHKIYESCGGKGANQAVALAKLGADTKLIGAVGSDEYGVILKENLVKYGINIEDIITIKDELSGRAQITVDKNGKNNIIVVPSANFRITKEDIDKRLQSILDSKAIVLQNEIPLEIVEYILKKSKELNKITIYNPAPAKKLTKEILQNTDYLILNESEIEEIFNIDLNSKKYEENILKIQEQYKIKTIILTLGDKGSILFNNKKITKYKAYDVNVVDTTAAGDSFLGAFTLKLLETENIDIAIKYATVVSALVVTKEGAQNSIPEQKEIEEFIEKRKKEF